MPSLSNTNLQRSRRWRLSGIDTIINFEAVEKYGVKAEGNTAGASAEVLAELAQCIERRELEIPIARVYSLANVREAYRELEHRHALGKIVLVP